MKYNGNKAENVKIAYIGGGSRGWAWGFMSDLAVCEDMSGDVYLYDIDYKAAMSNEIIGNKFKQAEGTKSIWNYVAVESIQEALQGADAVIISILPGTFDEMMSDVHWPEKYGIYQSVGDTTGPGGIIRAMRTIPMIEEIALQIKKHCPKAWVINYTNPMTLIVKALYRVFPEIQAFGCCHEVFGIQKLFRLMVQEYIGVEDLSREEIKVNPVGVNHFTWVTSASYKNIDLLPYYKEFCEEYKDGYTYTAVDQNWLNNHFKSQEKVKMELFRRFGVIAAAGDRHLAEFCPGQWYLENPERVHDMHYNLTTVEWRKKDLVERLEKSRQLVSGEKNVEINVTGEEGVQQLRALFGLREMVTNVNIPNKGQIPNLPIGAIVETNAVFRSNSITPVFAGEIPAEIYPLIARVCAEQEEVSEGIAERDLDKIFNAFAGDPLVTCSLEDARKMFKEMCQNTKKYLTMYNL